MKTLTKHKPLIYTRAQRAGQENKKVVFKLGQAEDLDKNNNHKPIKGQ